MSVDRSIQEEFARQMQKKYRESTRLPDFCNTRRFSEHDKNQEFIQLGKRVPIPVQVFDQGILQPTTGPFARSIITGEEKFFLTDLVNAADDGIVKSQKMDDLSLTAIEEAVKVLGKADTIFIPYVDEYTSTVNDWHTEKNTLPSGTQLEVAGSTLDIHRVVPKFGIKDVIVTNSRKIDLVQKQAEDTILPKGMDVDQSLIHMNEGQNFMVYFAPDTVPGEPEDQYDEYLDVLFRVIISQPMPRRQGAVRLEAPPDIELSDSND